MNLEGLAYFARWCAMNPRMLGERDMLLKVFQAYQEAGRAYAAR